MSAEDARPSNAEEDFAAPGEDITCATTCQLVRSIAEWSGGEFHGTRVAVLVVKLGAPCHVVRFHHVICPLSLLKNRNACGCKHADFTR